MVRSWRHRWSGLYTALVPHRQIVAVAIDFAAWWIALIVATTLRLEFSVHGFHLSEIAVTFVGISFVQLAIGAWEGLYLGRFSFGSFEEVLALVRSVLVTATVATVVVAFTHPIPTTVPIIAAFIALTVMAGSRYAW